MSKLKRLTILLLVLSVFTFSIACYVYLLTLPIDKLIYGKPVIWWLAFIPGLLIFTLLSIIVAWIVYLLITTPIPKPIEEEIEQERKKT